MLKIRNKIMVKLLMLNMRIFTLKNRLKFDLI